MRSFVYPRKETLIQICIFVIRQVSSYGNKSFSRIQFDCSIYVVRNEEYRNDYPNEIMSEGVNLFLFVQRPQSLYFPSCVFVSLSLLQLFEISTF